jgi:flagellar hook-associated protein 1
MSIGRVLDIAVRTMSVYQKSIDIASNNISNSQNPDYSRQRVLFGTEPADILGGMGVKIQDIQRIKDNLLETQLQKYQSSLSDANTRSTVLQQVEAIISEPSDQGLGTYFTNFFNSWSQLSASPNSIPNRLDVIQKAQSLSDRFKQTYDDLTGIQSTLQKDVYTKVDTLNTYLQQINSYNQQIYQAKSQGLETNELQDERDAVINNLSQTVNISVQSGPLGTATVNVGGIQGADLNGYNQFTVKIVNGKIQICSQNDLSSVAVINSGELDAITDLFSNKIPAYKAGLESLINTFVNKVNELHMQGNTLVQGNSSLTGIPFFGELDNDGKVTNAFVDGILKINPSIVNNPKNISASDTANNDGNCNIANKIAGLANNPIAELNGQSIIDNYTMILNNIGGDKTNYDNRVQTSQTVLQQLQTQKASNSGVSMDEEMTNVLKFQRSYDAAAKLVKVADEMIQTILNMVQ